MLNPETRLFSDLKEVLKNPLSLTDESEVAYYVFRGKPNITVINPGQVGDEYLKTFGHYHKDNREETYKVLYGKAIFLLQLLDDRNQENVADLKTVWAKDGDTIVVPPRYGHCLVNIGSCPLITIDDAPHDADQVVNDYEKIRERKGFAVYVVEKNGKIKFEPNENYNR